jgi:cob(I)alamin adenosyltransferase
MAIYTRTGDTGTTSLYGGKRVLKCNELVDVYGSLDELNSWVGCIVSEIQQTHIKKFLANIQSDLFLIGGHLAGWKTNLLILSTRITEVEVEIDAMDEKLPSLKNFIIPGGTIISSHVHLARSICRRVERQVVFLGQKQKIDPIIIQYLNRLSDLFFMMARYINNESGVADVVWSGKVRHSDNKNK